MKASPIIKEDPPPIPGIVSFGLGDAQGCEWSPGRECRLTVAAGLSSSGAKLYREQGSVTEAECSLFQTEAAKVQNGQMAFEEFKTNARAGKYFIPLGNGYCAQYPPKSDADMKKVTAPVWGERGGVWADFTNPIAIRKMTAAGGYSSITKLFIKPSIPFKVTFNGETFTIPLMTLFHPSPVRLENIQHDAMLTLGDPSADNRAKGSGATDAVILVPLVGSLSAGPSGDFISKIARYMTAVLQPDPVSGQYKTIDIPTGNDWDLSKLFPGTPNNGETVVATGYYAWSASGGIVKSTTPTITANPFPQADVWTYKYVPSGTSKVRYIMLKDPVPVNVFDLQTVRMLPATPAEQAIDSLVPSTLTFVTPKTCSTTPSAAGRESMTNQQCDPFAGVQSKAFTKDTLIQVIIGALTTFGVLLAIYFAVKLFANTDWGFKLPRMGHLFGNFAINFPLEEKDRVPVTPKFTSVADVDEMERKAKSRLGISGEVANPLQTVERRKSRAEEDARLIEAARVEAEAEAKRKSEEEAAAIDKAGREAEAEMAKKAEARLAAPTTISNPLETVDRRKANAIERARLDAEAAAKKKADEEAAAIEAARIEAEAAAKKKADEEAAAIEEARIEAEAEAAANRIRRETQERAPILSEEEMKRVREIGPAGTGLYSGEELKAAQSWDPKVLADLQAKTDKANKDAEETQAKLEAMRKRQAELQEKAEAAARKADEAEAKARERAAIEAKDMEETTPGEGPKRKRTTFAKTVRAPPPIIAEALKAKEVEDAKKAKEKAEKEAADKEAEVKRLSEEAAKSASKAAERQADLLKRAEEERQRQLKEYEAKTKEENARAFRPTSGRSTAAVPAAEAAPPVRNPREHPPPTPEEIQAVLGDVAESSKTAKTVGRALPMASKSTLGESETKAARDKLNALREKAFEAVAAATQAMNLRRSLWKNRSVWMRFEEEKKQARLHVSLVKKLVEYREAIESSGLDGLVRLGYANSLTDLTIKTLRLLEESKRRMTTLEDNAVPPIIKGGKRRRMKRKSTRRYVA